jgi:RNA recognition motif-containing protein
MRIYAGNLSDEVTEKDLRRAFLAFGQVSFVKINRDDVVDNPSNFGMIGMPVHMEAKAAITGLHGKKIKGKPISVNEAGTPSQ